MKIEEIDQGSLIEVDDKELYSLRHRFIQLWEKNFNGNVKKIAGTLERSDFLKKYNTLVRIMEDRELTVNASNIDRALFRSRMEKKKLGVNATELEDHIIIPDFVSIAGSFVTDKVNANDVDIIIRQADRDKGLELLLNRDLGKKLGLPIHFIYNVAGPHSSYIPMYSLVIRHNDTTELHVVKSKYFEGLDTWSKDFALEFVELCNNLVALDDVKPITVLDIGCGSGRIMSALQDMGYSVEGVDKNDGAIEKTKDKGIKVCKVNIDTEDLPFKDSSFDSVICTHTLEHVEKPEKVAKELMRVAKYNVVYIVPLGKCEDISHRRVYEKEADVVKDVGECAHGLVAGTKSAWFTVHVGGIDKGSSTSGNFEHEGRPGEVGGSVLGGGHGVSHKLSSTDKSAIEGWLDPEICSRISHADSGDLTDKESIVLRDKFYQAIDKLPPEQLIAYRGTRIKDEDMSNLKTGDIITVKHISSYADDEGYATEYTSPGGSGASIPKGMNPMVITADLKSAKGIGKFYDIPGITSTSEVVLPKDIKLKVSDTKLTSDGIFRIKVKEI